MRSVVGDRRASELLFSVTLFLGATLLFSVQPMVGKMLLPTYGGAPAVWITCMLFFQAILFAGYSYAHGASRRIGAWRHALLHVVLLALPLAVLPIRPDGAEPPEAGADPTLWLFRLLVVAAGAPLLLVSSTAPLLQRWYSHTGEPGARDPYFLYASSNAGSLFGLLGYPLFVEPNLTLAQQARWWTAGYALLVGAVGACAWRLWRAPVESAAGMARGEARHEGPAERIRPLRRVRWILLAFVPSSFLLGVTSHITTNIAAVPLLWVVPLALYLATFVLVFARRRVVPHAWVTGAFPYAVVGLGALTILDSPDLSWAVIPPHLVLFFVVAMMCHGELARTRPAPRHLTEFYFWIAVGGVLGGLFNAIVAPLAFDGIVEYPLVLALSCLLLPLRGGVGRSRRELGLDLAYPAVLAVALSLLIWGTTGGVRDVPGRTAIGVVVAAGAAGCFVLRDRSLRLGLGVAVYLALLGRLTGVPPDQLRLAERDFFGVKRVVDDADGRFRRFVHGTTNHGMQWLDPLRRDEPTAYYHRSGPMGDVFAALAERDGPHEAAIVGLGAGALACYAKPGQRFTFFEIDPAVVRIARDSALFTYLTDCPGAHDLVVGDGRLTLAEEPDAKYDLIVLDAFSSDAVPTHLLTREALELYLDKLGDGGWLVFNITNAYMDFESVMGNLARDKGLAGRHRDDAVVDRESERDGRMPSHYAVLTRAEEDLGALVVDPTWLPLRADPDARVWTDQFCDVLRLLRPPRRPAHDSR